MEPPPVPFWLTLRPTCVCEELRPSLRVPQAQSSSSAMAKLGTVGKSTAASRHEACAMGVTIVGTASMYDPFQPGYREGGAKTASGELYDPIAWTAAIQTDLRETFGGVRHGKDYRPAYALVEVDNKRAIIKIN